MSDPRVAIIGHGKMGRAVEQLARERGWPVAAVIDARANPEGRGITREALAGAEVAIEFTEPAAAPANVLAAVAAGCPVVSGTTGWQARLPEVAARVREAGGALFWAPNFSIGVAIFTRLVAEAGRALAGVEGFDAHLVETHHAAKKDAPSGTARLLATRFRETLGRELPVTSVRTGSVPGTHELLLDAPFEQIRLVHEARDRRVFADGALRAARWLVGRRGVFGMDDLLSSGTNTP